MAGPGRVRYAAGGDRAARHARPASRRPSVGDGMEGKLSHTDIYHRSTRCLLPVSMLHEAAADVAEQRQIIVISTAIVLF